MMTNAWAQTFEKTKRGSTAQLLFKCARLLNDEAVARLKRQTGSATLRAAHTSLLPHIDLGGTRATVIAARLGISKQAVGQLVDEMVEMGVLEEVDDPNDGRAKLIRFTARGQQGLLQGLAVLRELEGELGVRIGKARMKALHDTLGRLLGAISQLTAPTVAGAPATAKRVAAKPAAARGPARGGRDAPARGSKATVRRRPM